MTPFESHSRSVRQRWPLILFALMGLGALVRLHALTARDLWYDEQVTLVDSQGVRPPTLGSTPFSSLTLRSAERSLLAVARQSATHDQPVYVSLVHLWTRLVGAREFTLRLPSALFGTATIGLVALLGRRLLGEPQAILAALLLAISPLHVQYSQEARAYSLAVFLTLLSAVLLLRLSETASSLRWMAYGSVVASVPLAHLLAGVAVLPHAMILWPLRRQRRQLGFALLAALLVLAISLPLGWLQSVQTAHDQSGKALATPPDAFKDWAQPLDLSTGLAGLVSSITRVLGLDYFPFGWKARYLLPLSLPLLVLALWAGISRTEPTRSFLLGGALLPFAAALALSLFYGHVVTLGARYSAWCLPFWALLLAEGAMRMRARALASLTLLLLFAAFLLGARAVGWPRESVRGDEVRAFLRCAPTNEVLQVSGPWGAAVVAALADREIVLALGAARTEEPPRFRARASGICRTSQSSACPLIPACAGQTP